METHVDMDTARGLLVSLTSSSDQQRHLAKHWVKENDASMAEVALHSSISYADLSCFLSTLILDSEDNDEDAGSLCLIALASYADYEYRDIKMQVDGLANKAGTRLIAYLEHRMKIYAFIRDTIWIMTKVSELEKVTES